MRRQHKRYPEVGFDHNQGYGTPEHRGALDRDGPSPVHRLSFAPCAQPSLFADAAPPGPARGAPAPEADASA
jgi:ribonuclease HII